MKHALVVKFLAIIIIMITPRFALAGCGLFCSDTCAGSPVGGDCFIGTKGGKCVDMGTSILCYGSSVCTCVPHSDPLSGQIDDQPRDQSQFGAARLSTRTGVPSDGKPFRISN